MISWHPCTRSGRVLGRRCCNQPATEPIRSKASGTEYPESGVSAAVGAGAAPLPRRSRISLASASPNNSMCFRFSAAAIHSPKSMKKGGRKLNFGMFFWLFFFGLGCNFHCVLRSFLGFCSISTCFTVLEQCLFDSMYLACILLHVIVSLPNMLFES